MHLFLKGKGKEAANEEGSRGRRLSTKTSKATSTPDLHRTESKEGSLKQRQAALESPLPSPSSLAKNIETQRDEALAKLNGPVDYPEPQHSLLASSASSYFPSTIDSRSVMADTISVTSASTLTHSVTPKRKTQALDHSAAVRYTELVARVKRFLSHELGANALVDESVEEELEQPWLAWSTYDPEGYALWKTLRDGVLLCWLLNRFFPNSLSNIRHSESTIVRRQNIARFLDGAQKQLFLHPDDLFTVDDLSEGLPDPFSRVLHTILAVATAVRPEDEYKPKSEIRSGRVVSMGNATKSSPTKESIEDCSPSLLDHRRKHTSSSPTKYAPIVREKRSQVSFSANEVSLEGSRKAARFYGLDRRLSDTAVNLTTVQEAEPGSDVISRKTSLHVRPKAMPRAGSHSGLIAPRKRSSEPPPETTDSGFASCSPGKPVRPIRSSYRPSLQRSTSALLPLYLIAVYPNS